MLTTTTNARAELNDVFDPIIQNTLNNSATLYGVLKKEVNVGGDYARWRVRTGRNASAGSYAETDVITTGNAARKKVSSPIRLVKVGWDVSGLEIQAAKGASGIGDILGIEVQDATTDLLVELNTQLNGDGTAAVTDMDGLVNLVDDGVLFPTVYDVADRTVAGFEYLVSPTTDMAVAGIALADLRKMIRDVTANGASKENLIFVMSHEMKDAILNLIQALQHYVPVSTKLGFEGMPTFDGVPIHADYQTLAKAVFCLDYSTCMIKQELNFTMEELPTTTDSKSGFIKGYMQFIIKSPNRCAKYYNFA